MSPIPCAHCGNNFMRINKDPDVAKLCNNCLVREEARNPKGKEKMTTANILIEVSRETQIEIEEICHKENTNFSDYFLNLHRSNIIINETIEEMKKNKDKENLDVLPLLLVHNVFLFSHLGCN